LTEQKLVGGRPFGSGFSLAGLGTLLRQGRVGAREKANKG
jgi:hypothetical protein